MNSYTDKNSTKLFSSLIDAPKKLARSHNIVVEQEISSPAAMIESIDL